MSDNQRMAQDHLSMSRARLAAALNEKRIAPLEPSIEWLLRAAFRLMDSAQDILDLAVSGAGPMARRVTNADLPPKSVQDGQ